MDASIISGGDLRLDHLSQQYLDDSSKSVGLSAP
jgi:hypothetical protein